MHSLLKRGWCRAGFALAIFAVSTNVIRADVTNTGADVVPGDCLYFSTSLKTKENFEKLVNSPAMQKNLVPLIKKVWAKIKEEGPPQARKAIERIEDPRTQEALAVLFDLIGNESFSYIDRDWLQLVDKFQQLPQRLQGAIMMAALSGQQGEPQKIFLPPVIDWLIDSKLKLPPIVMGFKPSDPAMIAAHLEKLPQISERSPVKVTTTDINGSKFYVLQLTGKMLNIEEDKVIEKMEEIGVSEQRAKDFYEFLCEQKVAITAGVTGKYLIVSISADNSHLDRFGKAPFLSDHEALTPVRKHIASGKLLALSYTSIEVAKIGYQTPEEQQAEVEKGMAMANLLLPPGLGDKLKKDLKELVGFAAAMTPKPSETVCADIENNGVESFSYTKAVNPANDFSRPLTVLSHSGGKPFMAAASSSLPSASSYATFRDYMKKFYGYFQEYGLEKMDREAREKFQKFEAIVLPAIAQLDEITSKKWIPATDAGQTLFVMDFQCKAKEFPEGDLPKPMPLPEMAFGASINDGDLLREAVVDYVKVIDDTYVKLRPALIEEGAEEDKLPPRLPLMPPTATAMGDATQYHYPLPVKLDKAILPHIVLTKKFVAFTTSPSLSQRMLNASSPPTDGVVALDQPSATGFVMNIPPMLSAAKEWVQLAKESPNGPFAKAKGEEKEFLELGVNSWFDFMGMFKHVSMRVHKEGEYQVTHSWSQIDPSGN